jgi:hypothetical protein
VSKDARGSRGCGYTPKTRTLARLESFGTRSVGLDGHCAEIVGRRRRNDQGTATAQQRLISNGRDQQLVTNHTIFRRNCDTISRHLVVFAWMRLTARHFNGKTPDNIIQTHFTRNTQQRERTRKRNVQTRHEMAGMKPGSARYSCMSSDRATKSMAQRLSNRSPSFTAKPRATTA